MVGTQETLSNIVERRHRTWLRRPLWVFVAAIALRLAVLGVFVAHNPISWGVNEAAGIARALALGRGFSSPFHSATGPTAWLAPVYPGILAGLFLLFGIETTTSIWAAVLLNVLFSSLAALVVLQLGSEQFGETAGLVAGWLWAVSPPIVVMPWLPWETCLSALVMTFAFLRTQRLKPRSRWSEWAICGSIWSFAALLNPALLAPLPAIAAWAAWTQRRWVGPAVMLLVCALGIAPWTTRNFVSFHRVLPVRSNFWPEAYFGNVTFSLHPIGDSMLYQKEGEISFAADLRARVIDHVRSHPRDFVRLTGRRIYAFWTEPPRFGPYATILSLAAWVGIGVAARRRSRARFDFFSVLAFYPLIYYLTYTFARYRHPIEPLMYTLAGFAVCELVDCSRLVLKAGK
jgi:hypothetical protein